MIKSDQTLLAAQPTSISTLYDGYADKLLGYIFEIVKDRKVAEQYLVRIFNEISSTHFNKLDWDGTNTWCQLMRFAKNHLAAFDDAVAGCEAPANAISTNHSPNKYLEKMTDLQKLVFCNFYYHKKSTAQLSTELGTPEDVIRKALREAFTLIKASHGN